MLSASPIEVAAVDLDALRELKQGDFAKLDTSLALAYQSLGGESAEAPTFGVELDQLSIEEGRVSIDAVAAGEMADLRADLAAIGVEGLSSFGRVAGGSLPIDALDDLAQLDSLLFANASLAPQTNVGAVTSQGDVSMGADLARAAYGVDGSGVTVGVLSDSYDYLSNFDPSISAAADIASGDLPPASEITILDDSFSGIDEGRGMMQLIHDVAPGASLAFHTAAGGMANFATGILELAAVADADVIVDDIIYFAEPMFTDGIIAQAVDLVKDAGVSYFSSAGNGDRMAYESAFDSSGVPVVWDFGDPLFNGSAHDFDPGPGVDLFQSITVPLGGFVIFDMQWAEPYASASPFSPGSSNDLDFFLFDKTESFIIDLAVNTNNFFDPVEVTFGFFNDGSFDFDFDGIPDTEFNIVIEQFFPAFDPTPGQMKYVAFGDMLPNEYGTNSGTVFGHANANGAEAVGAAFYAETPAFGQDPALLEPFSSSGPTPILVTPEGDPTFEVRQKPEIVAPDGTNTTFFPPFPGADVEGDGFPNFFGTSAAAPHAAAVAALMHEARPGISPDSVFSVLEKTALDMDDADVPGFPDGVGFDSGHGLIQAVPAVSAVTSDVKVAVSGGSLKIKGDRETNLIAVDQIGLPPDAFRVTNHGGTINGGSESLVVHGIVKDVKIEGDRGDDLIEVGGGSPVAIAKNLDIRPGDGHDRTEIGSTAVDRDLKYSSKDGSSTLSISDSQVGKKLEVDIKQGDSDTLVENTVVADKAEFKTDDGDDQIIIRNSFVGDDLEVKADDGDNVIELIGSSVGRNVKLETKDDQDSVLVENSWVGRDLKVETKKGDDVVLVVADVGQLHVGRDLSIKTDRGDDLVGVLFNFSTVHVGKNLKIDTGKDDDVLQLDIFFSQVTIVDDLSLKTDKGDDTLEIVSFGNTISVGGDVKISAGDGDDQIDLISAIDLIDIGDDVEIDTGKGDDVVFAVALDSSVSIGDDLLICLTGGDLFDTLESGSLVDVGGDFEVKVDD